MWHCGYINPALPKQRRILNLKRIPRCWRPQTLRQRRRSSARSWQLGKLWFFPGESVNSTGYSWVDDIFLEHVWGIYGLIQWGNMNMNQLIREGLFLPTSCVCVLLLKPIYLTSSIHLYHEWLADPQKGRAILIGIRWDIPSDKLS